MKPITPEEAIKQEGSAIPDEVILRFNTLIIKNMRNRRSVIKISEAIAALENIPGYSAEWLDVEPIFRRAGWDVHYDKPGYNESYEGYYEFTAK